MNNDLQKLGDAITQIQNYTEKAQDYLPGIVRNYRKLEGDLDEARKVAAILADGMPTNLERAWAEKMVTSWDAGKPK